MQSPFFSISIHSRVQAVEELRAAGIPCRAVLDSAVGYIMDKIDFVFVGAEGVVENGGVINQVNNVTENEGGGGEKRGAGP